MWSDRYPAKGTFQAVSAAGFQAAEAAGFNQYYAAIQIPFFR